MATKKYSAPAPTTTEALDLALQQKGLDIVKKLYLAGVNPTGPALAAYNTCARGLPTQGDVATIESYLSSLLDG